jgi:hypothetical protein
LIEVVSYKPLLKEISMIKSLSRTLNLAALCASLTVATNLHAAEQSVTGIFRGNGKDAKLAYAVARPGEPFSGEETIIVVLTEKDTAGEDRSDIMAAFGQFGSALILTFQRSGDLVGCEVAHRAHEKSPFSSIGKLEVKDFKIDGDRVQAKLSTGGEVESFGSQTWEVDLSFSTKVK